MYTSSSLKAELNAKGWRLTPQREVILQVFQNLPRGKHLSAEELFELLEKQEQGISLSTIYRTLKLMTRMGILRELELAEVHKHYELNTTSPNHHHHIVCTQCNMTIEFENSTILKQAMKQVEKSGLELIDCQLTIYAICPEAIRKGFPAVVSPDWVCSRAISAANRLKEEEEDC
ncbi:Fur family transcriptional regulator [Calothrix sp. NIES-3974]|uniref:Fur family transcriptional regulator n=1 Tax=Calothrix sp. NIES-3974 TaxID=2005462 RepID=UPI000B610D11|nr:Fur family transcriptional regulator [Calothrix sp. NIES-3974]BAZ07552.1 ferric uptake regulation protein [Calothrix sp. NIES-3974]